MQICISGRATAIREAPGRPMRRRVLAASIRGCCLPGSLIILDDADLDRAASAGAFGSFLHQGQICMTTGRHLVHEAVYDDYVAALAAKAAHLPVGDPATGQVALGPVIDERQRDKIHALVTGSTDAGARLAAGGTYQGLFYQPTVLAEVTPDMPAYASEVRDTLGHHTRRHRPLSLLILTAPIQAGSHVTPTRCTAQPYSSAPIPARAWLEPRAPGRCRGRR